MKMNKDTIAVLIGFLPNHRIIRRIAVEKQFGDVHLICWDRGSNMLLPPVEDGFTAHIINITASNDPLKRILPTRRFAIKANNILENIHPAIIHVQGLDMLQIAIAYQKNKSTGTKIIYEVADLHRYIVDKQKDLFHRVIRRYLIYKDYKSTKRYDLLIITSEAYEKIYFGKFVPKEKILFMPNMPDISIYRDYCKKRNGEFTVGYIGGVRYKKQIYNLIEAAKVCNIKLFFAGFEDEPIEIEPICKAEPNIEWVGRFEYVEAPKLYGKCDVVYSVYDADMANVRVALPNKLYEAIFCEMPIIVAKDTYLAELVTKWGVGIVVNHREIKDLVEGIKELQKKEVRDRCVDNCRRCKKQWKRDIPDISFKESLEKLITGE